MKIMGAIKRVSILILVEGGIAILIGAWGKITHQSFGDTLLTVGLISLVLAILLAAVTLISKSRPAKDLK